MTYLRVLALFLLLVALTTEMQLVHADDPGRRETLSEVLDAAAEYSQLRTVIVAQAGKTLTERGLDRLSR
jgi:hypothetical protein